MMGEQLHTFFQIFSHRKIVVVGLALFVVFSLAPVQFAQAENIVSQAVGGLAGAIANGFANIFASVGDFFLAPIALGVKLIAGLIAQGFIGIINLLTSVQITPPDAPTAINNGWNFSRQLVNIFFILILVFVGLATILRLPSYETQKILPTLIVTVFLVNFSGVFVGFIVDIGNIVTKTFLNLATKTDFSLGGGISSFGDGSAAANFGKHIVQILYYAFAILVLFITVLLFAVRVLVLWTITILAPLAFAARILPATQQYWKQWFTQLVQWSIIGIPMSFFLLLAKGVLEGKNGFSSQFSSHQAFAELAAPFTALFLLSLGVMISMQTSAMGAQMVINKGKKWGMNGFKAAGSATWRKFGKKFEGAGKWLRERGQGLPADAPTSRLGKTLSSFGKYTGIKTLSKTKVARFGARKLGKNIEIWSKELTMRNSRKDQAEIAKATKEATGQNSEEVINQMREEFLKGLLANLNRLAGLLGGVIKNGDIDDVLKAFEDGRINKKDIGKIFEAAERGGSPTYRPIAKALYGEFMTQARDYGISEEKRKQLETEIPKKVTDQDIKDDIPSSENLDPTTPEGKAFLRAMVLQRDADLLPALARRPDKGQRDKIMDFIYGDAPGSIGVDELARSAPGALRYITSTAARSAGVGTQYAIEDVERKIREAQQTALDPLRSPSDIQREMTAAQQEFSALTPRGDVSLDPADVQRRQELTQAINQLTQELQRTQGEFKMLTDAANIEFGAQVPGNPRTFNEVQRDIQRNYEQKYRRPLYQQLGEEAPTIQWDAAERFSGNFQQARASRMEELYDRFRMKETRLTPEPKPTAKEKELFGKIARGTMPVPDPKGSLREKKLAGMLQESLQYVQQMETQITRLSREILEKAQQGQAAPLQETKRANWYNELEKAKTVLAEIRRRPAS